MTKQDLFWSRETLRNWFLLPPVVHTANDLILFLGVAEGAVNKEEAFKREGPGVYSHNCNKLNQSK